MKIKHLQSLKCGALSRLHMKLVAAFGIISVLSVISTSFLVGYEGVQPSSFFAPDPTPWFTGNLLAPSGFVAPPGNVNISPYLSANTKVGRYDADWKNRSTSNFYNLRFIAQFKVGVIPRVDFQITPFVEYKTSEDQHGGGFGDLPIGVGIQLYRPTNYRNGPGVKLAIKAFIPTGKYCCLEVAKRGTDITGSGSWFPGPQIAMSQFFHLSGLHYLELRFGSEYRFGTPVHLKGISAYGGDPTTRGEVRPGNLFRVITAAQYNFTQAWACACDFLYSHSDRDHFSGKTVAKVGLPSAESFSLSPAIEYNFTKNVGLIGGVWFSLAGRNASKFVNGIISLTASF